MSNKRINEVTEEYLKTRWSGTKEIVSILEILHKEGIGDAFCSHRGKMIARKLRPIFRKMAAQAIYEDIQEQNTDIGDQ